MLFTKIFPRMCSGSNEVSGFFVCFLLISKCLNELKCQNIAKLCRKKSSEMEVSAFPAKSQRQRKRDELIHFIVDKYDLGYKALEACVTLG